MKIKIPRFRLRKKLRAKTSRRSSALAAHAMDYEEMSEPNMKLSRALLIVLVLHVVAVAGIIAFNSLKTHQAPRVGAAPAAKSTPAPVAKPEATAKPAVVEQTTAKQSVTKAAHSPAKIAQKEERRAEAVKPAVDTAALDPTKTYVVVKGDNPVTIAKKLNVSYDELLAINHITDPHKLQIGQKLRIPESKAAKR